MNKRMQESLKRERQKLNGKIAALEFELTCHRSTVDRINVFLGEQTIAEPNPTSIEEVF